MLLRVAPPHRVVTYGKRLSTRGGSKNKTVSKTSANHSTQPSLLNAERNCELHIAYSLPCSVVDVEQHRAVVPCSPWPKDPRLKHVGLYQLQNILDGIRGVCFKMVRLADYSVAETEAMIAEAKRICRRLPEPSLLVGVGGIQSPSQA
jgi:hypothetical protein